MGPRHRRHDHHHQHEDCRRGNRRRLTLNSPPCSTRSASTHHRSRCSAQPSSVSSPGRTSSTRSTDTRRRGSSSRSATDGRQRANGVSATRPATSTFSRPDRVFLDACHSADGYHPGPLNTANGLVTALSEQRGWVDVTDPTPILVNGYPGQSFQRIAPAEFVDCDTSFAPFRSWENEDENGNQGWSYSRRARSRPCGSSMSTPVSPSTTRSSSSTQGPGRTNRRPRTMNSSPPTRHDPHRPGMTRPAPVEPTRAPPSIATEKALEVTPAPSDASKSRHRTRLQTR